MKPKLPLAPDEFIRLAAKDVARANEDPENFQISMASWLTREHGVCAVCLGGAALLSIKTVPELMAMPLGRDPGYWAQHGEVHPADADRMIALDFVRVGNLRRALWALCGWSNPTITSSFGVRVELTSESHLRVTLIAEAWCLAARNRISYLEYDPRRVCIHPLIGWNPLNHKNLPFFREIDCLAEAWLDVPEVERQWFCGLITPRSAEIVEEVAHS